MIIKLLLTTIVTAHCYASNVSDKENILLQTNSIITNHQAEIEERLNNMERFRFLSDHLVEYKNNIINFEQGIDFISSLIEQTDIVNRIWDKSMLTNELHAYHTEWQNYLIQEHTTLKAPEQERPINFNCRIYINKIWGKLLNFEIASERCAIDIIKFQTPLQLKYLKEYITLKHYQNMKLKEFVKK